MNDMDPLAALRPLHAPPAISWWPPAPGWWLLLAFLLLATLLGIWWWRSNAPKRAALRELKSMQSLVQDPVQQAAAVNRLLKRYALLCWPRHETAALSGEAWLAFLDAHGGKGRFTQGPGQLLMSQPYATAESADSTTTPDQAAVFRLVRNWLKANRPRVRK
jgi:hypothetical protein